MTLCIILTNAGEQDVRTHIMNTQDVLARAKRLAVKGMDSSFEAAHVTASYVVKGIEIAEAGVMSKATGRSKERIVERRQFRTPVVQSIHAGKLAALRSRINKTQK